MSLEVRAAGIVSWVNQVVAMRLIADLIDNPNMRDMIWMHCRLRCAR